MESKKVIIFIPSFERGGVEKNVIYFTEILLKNGFEVEIFYVRALEDFFKKLPVEVKKVKFKRIIKIPFLHPRLIDSINIFIPAIFSLIRKKRKSKIFFISFQNNQIGILIAKLAGIKVAIRIAASPYSVKYSAQITDKIAQWFKKYIYKFADIIIANSKDTARIYNKLLGKNVITIYNPVNFELLNKKAKEKVDHLWFVNKKKPIVIGVGRLTRQKDFPTLIKAFSQVKREIDARLVILGEGEDRPKLEKLIKKLGLESDIWMPGFVKNPYKYIAKSDVFVLSSLYEGLPNVLIEAIALGVPAISTDCLSGPKEILFDGEGGDLVPVGDYKALSNSIINYLKNFSYAKKKWEIAYNGLYRFSFEEYEKKWLEVLRDLEK